MGICARAQNAFEDTCVTGQSPRLSKFVWLGASPQAPIPTSNNFPQQVTHQATTSHNKRHSKQQPATNQHFKPPCPIMSEQMIPVDPSAPVNTNMDSVSENNLFSHLDNIIETIFSRHAAQVEGTLEKLQHKVKQLKMGNAESSNPTPTTAQPMARFRRAQSEPASSIPSSTTPKRAGPSTTAQANKSTSASKKKPNQMITDDFPDDFKATKECLFVHIRLLWGLLETASVPPVINAALVAEFSLNIFRQIAMSGAYDFMNFNRKYKDNMVIFIRAYNHYVHHVQLDKFSKENKEPGKHAETVMVKNAARKQSRLAEARYKFAVANDFPKRYKDIIQDVAANSNDEWDEAGKCFVVKTLPFRSKAANIFFRRLDSVMNEVAIANGKSSQSKPCRVPREPVLSIFPKVPRQLPLDFYLRCWLGNLPTPQQREIPDLTRVAFLLDPSKSLLPQNHPNYNAEEALLDSRFSRNKLAPALILYKLVDIPKDNKDEGDGEEEEVQEDSIDLAPLEENDDQFVAEGDWENVYDEDEDEDYEEEMPASVL
ncbi:hypothetical protein PTTG_10009 [Puccinia triticina 1-1 BBBD Race 1]|uniref:Uncharacterized protein n=1 Tax=Puccinia triticina (isolate 1-1 / race 1 (BBBD)) TaxID=630390 RepID=A0A180GT83_PUCT1|nr:hypothetical protein PTTG_10009 [Puccinia triticina 1-1 BBBD Race 1]